MGDQVGQRLLHAAGDPQRVAQHLADVVQHLLAAAAAARFERGDELRDAHRDGVLIELRASRLPHEGPNLLDRLESLLDPPADCLRSPERRLAGGSR